MPHILIVEDNAENRDMLSRRLVRRGYAVSLAHDGQAALDFVQEHVPDLILMDMSLPVMDGWTASQTLKSRPTTSQIPIIALTAHAMASDRDRALAAGCDDFHAKPVDLAQLLAQMDRLLVPISGDFSSPADAVPDHEPE